jgi:hypothetical protein
VKAFSFELFELPYIDIQSVSCAQQNDLMPNSTEVTDKEENLHVMTMCKCKSSRWTTFGTGGIVPSMSCNNLNWESSDMAGSSPSHNILQNACADRKEI